MTTKFVSIKEFRQNIASFAEHAKTHAGKERLIVMSHSTPLFEVTPFGKSDTLNSLVFDIALAEEDVRNGHVYTHNEVVKMLGI